MMMMMMMMMMMIIIIIIIIIIMMMMMMMMMIIIIIIIIISSKSATRDLLQSPHCSTNCLQCVRLSGPGAIVCKSRACNTSSAYHVQPAVSHLERRDSSAIKFDRVEMAFISALFYWLKRLTDEGGGEENP